MDSPKTIRGSVKVADSGLEATVLEFGYADFCRFLECLGEYQEKKQDLAQLTGAVVAMALSTEALKVVPEDVAKMPWKFVAKVYAAVYQVNDVEEFQSIMASKKKAAGADRPPTR